MPKPKVSLLVNLVAPSRLRVYERLAAAFDLLILHGEMECNRISWDSLQVKGARMRRVWGWQLLLKRKEMGKVFDHRFVHLEPGYITQLLRERPEAVISFEMGFRTLVALAYGACFSKPVWIWWGGTSHTERQLGRFRKLVRRFLARWAKYWISYGETSTDYLLTLGVPRQRILQVQNCVDETFYGSAVQPAFDVQPKPVLLCVGQMIGRKGVAEFLLAAASLQRQKAKFSILLVGGGADCENIRRLVADLRLENVHFRPATTPQSMPAVYCSADVFVFPTMEDVWGLVVNEALLAGLPVLCSKYAGCASELFDSANIFDPRDEEQFVTSLRTAIAGNLPRGDLSRLKRSSEIGDMIVDAVLSVLRAGVLSKDLGDEP